MYYLEELKQDINNKDHMVINISNVRRIPKESLLMFFMELKPELK
jgi:hypothetical protein